MAFGEIIRLPSEVIDQIAAGEVVERPAHMVKELVENSIDSEATEVEVDVTCGGRNVRVTDDGHGIPEKQLELALSRHATSKIRQASDLWEIHSFGFRGEALASVAAVSKLSLISKVKNQDSAFRLSSHFGRLGKVERVGGRNGTQIIVEDLFENVPARMKFLKSDSGEISQIKNTLKALALSHPEVEMRLKVDGQLVYIWPKGQSLVARAAQILDVEPLHEAAGELGDYRLRAVFAPPQAVFGNSRNMWFFAQGRWIQDRSIQAAVLDAYRGLLMHGEFPYVALYLTCKSGSIDVNVHPTKSQVKFQDAKSVFRLVQRTIRGELEKAPWLKHVLGDKVAGTAPMVQEESNASFFDAAFQQVQYRQKEFPGPQASSVRSAVKKYTADFFETPKQVVLTKENGEQRWSDLQVLGQADSTYIIAQSSEKLVFIDQHAAHERVAYERLMQLWKAGGGDIQRHLIPLTLEMDEDGVENILSVRAELRKMGLEIEQAGPNLLNVCSSPTILSERSIHKALVRLSEEIAEKGGSFAFEKAISDVCATMACHSVVRAGQALSLEEMKSLLIGMDEFKLSSFCPHGRPVFVDYPFSRLERDFGRIV